MIRRILGLFILTGWVLAANAEINTGIGQSVSGSTKAKPKAPANHEMFQPPASASAKGEVMEAISGAGYTYLHLKAGGQDYWVAGTQVSAKKGDMVKYDENVVMHNFFSKTLNRSFDKIIFASHVTVVK